MREELRRLIEEFPSADSTPQQPDEQRGSFHIQLFMASVHVIWEVWVEGLLCFLLRPFRECSTSPAALSIRVHSREAPPRPLTMS